MNNKNIFICGLLLIASMNAFGQAASVLPTSLAPVVRGSLAACPNGEEAFFNQTPDQSNGLFSDFDCDFCTGASQSIADDFILATATEIGQLVMYAGYFPSDLIPVPADPWTIIIHEDLAGLPGAAINTQTVTPSAETITGVTLFGVSEIEYVFTIAPVALPAGTYWIEIETNTAGSTDSAFWEAGVLDTLAGRLDAVFATETPGVTWTPLGTATDMALTMCGPAIQLPPPPAIPALGKSGLAALALLLLVGSTLLIRRHQ